MHAVSVPSDATTSFRSLELAIVDPLPDRVTSLGAAFVGFSTTQRKKLIASVQRST
jgi:hypothetical protein